MAAVLNIPDEDGAMGGAKRLVRICCRDDIDSGAILQAIRSRKRATMSARVRQLVRAALSDLTALRLELARLSGERRGYRELKSARRSERAITGTT